MVHGVVSVVSKIKQVLQTEGLIPLLRRGFPFLLRYFLQYGTFYLYKHTLKERIEADFMPRIQDFTLKVVSTNKQADQMSANGFEDFRQQFINARRGLDKGAIAFCVYVGSELAHIGWAAMSEEAKNTFDGLPYHVDFSDKEACTGGTVTIPKYRGKGLMTYGYFKRFQFLRQKGIVATRNAVNTNNIASHRAMAKFSPDMYARARYLKVLWWKSWRETQLTKTGQG